MEDLQAEILSLYNRIETLERQATTRQTLLESMANTAKELHEKNRRLASKCRRYERQLGMTPISR